MQQLLFFLFLQFRIISFLFLFYNSSPYILAKCSNLFFLCFGLFFFFITIVFLTSNSRPVSVRVGSHRRSRIEMLSWRLRNTGTWNYIHLNIGFVKVFHLICKFSAKDVVSFKRIEPHRTVEVWSQIESGADTLFTAHF